MVTAESKFQRVKDRAATFMYDLFIYIKVYILLHTHSGGVEQAVGIVKRQDSKIIADVIIDS